MSDPIPERRGRPVQWHEEPAAFASRRRILRIGSGEEELQRALVDGYHVVVAGSDEVPDIVVADLASLGQLNEIQAFPGRGW